jgi:hypothetical protein
MGSVGGFYCIWDLGFMRVLSVVGCLGPCRSYWILFRELTGLFICILPVYLEAPYSFLIKNFLLIKKKRGKKKSL